MVAILTPPYTIEGLIMNLDNQPIEILKQTAERILGHRGQMISMSKGQYRWNHPRHVVFFNGRIFFSGKQIWNGDIDLTESESKIVELARELNGEVSVTSEHDTGSLDGAYCTDGENFQISKYYERENGKLLHKEPKKPSEEELEKQAEEIRNSYKQEDYELVRIKVSPDEADEDLDLEYGFNFEECFINLTKDVSPIHKFWDLVKEELDTTVTGEELFSRLCISKEDYEFLEKQFEYWFRIFHGRYLSEYRITSNVSFAAFNHMPNHFMEDPRWLSGVFYLKKPKEL